MNKLSIRVVVIIVTILLIVASINIYDQPFVGCENYSIFGLQVFGCSVWPHFARGLALVSIFWILLPFTSFSKYFGFIIVLILAVLGGLEAIQSGLHLELFNNPSSLQHYWVYHGVPSVVGGGVGVIIFIYFDKKLFQRKQK
jgi:hypothetical protein